MAERENIDESKNDPDAIIKAGDPLSDQLFDQVAIIASIDDALFHLDQCLANDLIQLQPYLKQVRMLSRQQFMAKALATKIAASQKKSHMLNSDPSRPPPMYGAMAASGTDFRYPSGK